MAELKYEHLLGREFRHGRQDCYTLVRDFYRDNYGLTLRNYARPDNHWDLGFNLYMACFHAEGFRVLDVHPTEWRPGDVILCAIRSEVANHAGILVDNGMILHHLYGGLSEITGYRALLRNTTVAVLRHKDVVVEQTVAQLDLMEILPDAIRRKISAAIAGQRQRESGPDPV